MEAPAESNLLDYKNLIVNMGYICMSQNADGISFNKGYTSAKSEFVKKQTEKAREIYGDRY